MQSFFLCRSCGSRLQHAGSGAPRADAVGDATQGLEIGPFRELVVFGRGRDVCADNTHREVRDVGEGDLGAVELEGNLLAGCWYIWTFGEIEEIKLTFATLYCRLLVMYSSTEPGCLDRISPALNLSSRALFKGMVPVTLMPDIASRFAFCASSLMS